MRRLMIQLAAVFSFLAIAGCASSGRQIEQTNIQKIIVGTTSKQQLIEMFGPPLSQSYGTEGKLTMLWHYVYVGPFGTGMKQQNLAVLFDQQERVEKYNLVDNTGNGPRLGP
jgi:outer membrane protein assembly factor BamE (lipoprotein component of BamABCDE complex)